MKIKKHLKTVNLEEPEMQNYLYLLIHYYTTSETQKNESITMKK